MFIIFIGLVLGAEFKEKIQYLTSSPHSAAVLFLFFFFLSENKYTNQNLAAQQGEKGRFPLSQSVVLFSIILLLIALSMRKKVHFYSVFVPEYFSPVN